MVLADLENVGGWLIGLAFDKSISNNHWLTEVSELSIMPAPIKVSRGGSF